MNKEEKFWNYFKQTIIIDHERADKNFWQYFGQNTSVNFQNQENLPSWIKPKSEADIVVNYKYFEYKKESNDTPTENMYEWIAEILAPSNTIYENATGLKSNTLDILEVMQPEDFNLNVTGLVFYKAFPFVNEEALVGKDFKVDGYVKPTVTDQIILPKTLIEMFDPYTKNFQEYTLNFKVSVRRLSGIRLQLKYLLDRIPYPA